MANENVSLASLAAFDQMVRILQIDQRFAYLLLAADLTVLKTSANVSQLFPDLTTDMVGQPLLDLFWELGGLEAELTAVLANPHPKESYVIEGVNRQNADQETHYYTFRCLATQNLASGAPLLLIIEDITEFMFLSQSLQQERNELHLLRQELKRLAVTDALTGLSNRRYFDEALQREVERSRELGQPVTLLMIDIDNFKLLNDTYGHPAGDAQLKKLAHTLQNHTRRFVDLSARYGGEEFALILPGVDAQMGREIAERLRQAIQTALYNPDRVPNPNRDGPGTTVSIGLASCPEHAVAPTTLLEAADLALYVSKRTGKNRVALFSPQMRGG